MPLPTAEIQAFSRPTVKDGVLTQPVTLAGEAHGLCAPASAWRAAAWQILAVTEANKPRARSATAAVRKPSGGIL